MCGFIAAVARLGSAIETTAIKRALDPAGARQNLRAGRRVAGTQHADREQHAATMACGGAEWTGRSAS